ncbi:hypothetical protein MMPV_004537 [Pyropia vietnamensis]
MLWGHRMDAEAAARAARAAAAAGTSSGGGGSGGGSGVVVAGDPLPGGIPSALSAAAASARDGEPRRCPVGATGGAPATAAAAATTTTAADATATTSSTRHALPPLSPQQTAAADRPSKCPVDHRNLGSGGGAAALRDAAAARTSSSSSSSLSSSGAAAPVPSAAVGTTAEGVAAEVPASDPPSKCPVDHRKLGAGGGAAALARAAAAAGGAGRQAAATATTSAPSAVASAGATASGAPPQPVYDVYGNQLDPRNLMPTSPNQTPSPGQRAPLSTNRERSSIPKVSNPNSPDVWVYPSQQMFYNALSRKGKAADVEEADMDAVVAVHNSMNEATWAEVLAWERAYHAGECAHPSLAQFRGRPHDRSPASRFRGAFRGYPAPFDRHDWTVDRCGTPVRYIIDYYHWDDGRAEPIEIHVRPAADSAAAVWDRLRYRASVVTSGGRADILSIAGSPGAAVAAADAAGVAHAAAPVSTTAAAVGATTEEGAGGAKAASAARAAAGPGTVVNGEQLDEEEFAFLSGLTVERVRTIGERLGGACGGAADAVRRWTGVDEERKAKAMVALNYCVACEVCPRPAAAFMEAMEASVDADAAPAEVAASAAARRAEVGGDGGGTAAAEPGFVDGKAAAAKYEAMTACLDRFHVMASRVLAKDAGITALGPEVPPAVGIAAAVRLAKTAKEGEAGGVGG